MIITGWIADCGGIRNITINDDEKINYKGGKIPRYQKISRCKSNSWLVLENYGGGATEFFLYEYPDDACAKAISLVKERIKNQLASIVI
jgi:hypothetical protein